MDKPQFSPSSIATYNFCPHAKKLKDEHNVKSEPSDAMKAGLLFEGYLFGFKGDSQKELEGRKFPKSLDKFKTQAEWLKPVFTEGSSFNWIEYESKYWNLRGEIDYYGFVDTEYLSELCGQQIDAELSTAIVDIKYTGNVQKMWDAKTERESLLQSICYPYMIWKTQGEKLPFFYLIIDAEFEKPIVRVQQVIYNDFDFQFIERLLNQCANDIFFEAKISDDTCGGAKNYQSRCRYAELCEFGRAFIGGYKEIVFNN